MKKFKCQNSGKCCSHSKMVVTLTHEDILQLMKLLKDFSLLLPKVQFMVTDDEFKESGLEKNENKTVLKRMKTTAGNGVFILRRNNKAQCTFFDDSTNLCTIYEFRPQACQNFPFSYKSMNSSPGSPIIVSWVNGAKSFCHGIGLGSVHPEDMLESIGRVSLQAMDDYTNIVEEINYEFDSGKPLTPQEALVTLFMVAQKYNESLPNNLL